MVTQICEVEPCSDLFRQIKTALNRLVNAELTAPQVKLLASVVTQPLTRHFLLCLQSLTRVGTEGGTSVLCNLMESGHNPEHPFGGFLRWIESFDHRVLPSKDLKGGLAMKHSERDEQVLVIRSYFEECCKSDSFWARVVIVTYVHLIYCFHQLLQSRQADLGLHESELAPLSEFVSWMRQNLEHTLVDGDQIPPEAEEFRRCFHRAYSVNLSDLPGLFVSALLGD